MAQTEIVTRFAPSPTGFLHIGSARTALFNWLYARGRGGKFLLRIEDTDRARYSVEAVEAITEGLSWLGLDWDGEASSQHDALARHAEVARGMWETGAAYKCFATQDEIQAFREAARAEGASTLFRSPWRDRAATEHPDLPFVIRLKAPQDGETRITDAVQGAVRWGNEQLDDMVLLRSDGTPTYMLAVVVDDHDSGVTHVIRGDDHLANAARQTLLYNALGWDVPIFAHIPLIHGPDGKKLSKRHGALGIEEYRAMGYTPAGLRNYLARLGWSHGDDEVFTTEQALDWFDLDGVGKGPARLDFKKLESIVGQHIAMSDDKTLLHDIDSYLASSDAAELSAAQKNRLKPALSAVKSGSRNLPALLGKAHFILGDRPFSPDEKAAKALDSVSIGMLKELTPHLRNATWKRDPLEQCVIGFAEDRGLGFGKLAGPLRAALSGRAVSPSVFDMMLVIGQAETLARIADVTE